MSVLPRRGLPWLCLALAACSPAAPPPPAPAPAASAAPSWPRQATLRLLFTSDEHGWIAPATDKGKARGGAPELLARWRAHEGHCVPGPAESCEASATLALSGGDNWTGPALSSYFSGEPAAEALRRLGYAASALGNHELDFGRQLFEKNAARQQIPYVAANVTPALGQGGVAAPFVLARRQGVTVGIVGLSTRETPKAGMRDNYRGLDFGDEEKALEKAVPAAYAAGADVVVVIAHVCAAELRPMLARHPDFHLAFVGGGHCHRTSSDQVFATPLIEVGSFLQSYARVTLVVDRERAARDRLVSSKSELIKLDYPEGTAPPVEPDRELTELVATWQKKTDEALGEVIGHTNEPLEPDTPALTNFLTDRWREAVGADVAILNRFATRQSIPKGPISLGTIYSVLPFNNQLVTVRVTGEQLIHDVTCCGGHVSGVKSGPDGTPVLPDGRPIDRAARYTVVATDYAYFGGSGFPFEKQDPNPTIGEDWRLSLIRWLRKNPTSPDRGLDQIVDRRHRLRDKKDAKDPREDRH